LEIKQVQQKKIPIMKNKGRRKSMTPLFVAMVAKIFPSKSIFSLIASWKVL
jgi:hypothetical protein